MTIKGFNAYGGIDGCAQWATTCTPNPAWAETQYGFVGDGSANLFQTYQCGGGGAVHQVDMTLPQEIMWPSVPSSVMAFTRIDSDTARVKSVVIFPSPLAYSVCPHETHVISASLHHLVSKFDGQNGAPNTTWYRDGYHPVL